MQSGLPTVTREDLCQGVQFSVGMLGESETYATAAAVMDVILVKSILSAVAEF